MKRLITILTLFYCLAGLAQPDTTFNNLYSPYNGTVTISSLIEADSFIYACYSLVDTPDLVQKFGLLKFDKDGVLLDSSLYGFSDTGVAFNFGHSFILTTDNHLVLCASTRDDSGIVRGLLIKANLLLDTIWTKWINHPDTIIAMSPNPAHVHTGLSDVKETPNGNYVMVGDYTKDCLTNNFRCLMIVTDDNGIILSYNIYPYQDIQTYDVEVTQNGGFLFLGVRSYNLTLFRTDSIGVVKWSKTLSNGVLHKIGHDITIYNDSIVFVGSQFYNDGIDGAEYLVEGYKINVESKTIIWQKTFPIYSYLKNKTAHQSLTLEVANDSNLIIAGTSSIFLPPDSLQETPYRGTLFKFTPDGDSLWARWYAHDVNDGHFKHLQLNDLIVLRNGGLLFGGQYDNFTMYDKCWLVRTDSLGMAPATFTLSIDKSFLVIENNVKLFPNPTTGKINLSSANTAIKDAEICIYNANGQMVKEKRYLEMGSKTIIDIRELHSGIYILKITAGSQLIFTDKIIKQ